MPELATFAFFAYRHESFVVEALEAVAKQTYRPLEVVICDDGSPDRTRELIQKTLETFPPDISVIRIFHERNLGLPAAIDAVSKASSGRVIIFGAGDDVSIPDRVQRTMEVFKNPEISFVYTAVLRIQADGTPAREQQAHEEDSAVQLGDLLSGYANPIIGASCAYSANIFRLFSPLPAGLLREDAILPIRALLIGQGKFLSARLVHYRTHSGNLHSQATISSSQEMAARNLSFAEDRRVGSTQIVCDLATAAALGVQIPDDVREFVAREQAYSNIENALLRSSWMPIKIAIISKAWLFRKIRTASAAKLLALFVAPRLYVPLLRIRIRLSELKRQMRHG
jgi:hypothetical protein